MPLAGQLLETPTHLAQLLSKGFVKAPDDTALIADTKRWSYRDLSRASTNLAGNLLELGLRPGDRVASLMPNRAALIVHYLACMKAGLVGVPLNYRYTIPEIDRALKVSGASILLAHAERKGDLIGCARVRELPHGTVLYESGEQGRPDFRAMTDATPAKQDLPVHNASDPAFIFFTSGSTGPAKGVTHSYGSLGWMFASAAAALELTPGDIVLRATSLSHLGAVMSAFAALAAGARLIVPHSLDNQCILTLLREQRPTMLWMQPTSLFSLVRDPSAQRADFSSLRFCGSGSDKAPAELAQEFNKRTGMAINEGYGMTEVGFVAMNPPSGVVKSGSVGRAAPNVRLSIRDENGRELPSGVAGRLWISTPSLTVGYWGDPDATAAVMRQEWLDSGDVVRADEEGYLTFCGRSKQLIIHDGSNIVPQEVEDALLHHAAIAAAGVVGAPDLVHGEIVFAFVTLKQGAAVPTERELVEFARSRVGYKAPEKIQFLAEMPLNEGKVDRATLRKLAADATSPETHPSP